MDLSFHRSLEIDVRNTGESPQAVFWVVYSINSELLRETVENREQGAITYQYVTREYRSESGEKYRSRNLWVLSEPQGSILRTMCSSSVPALTRRSRFLISCVELLSSTVPSKSRDRR